MVFLYINQRKTNLKDDTPLKEPYLRIPPALYEEV